MQPLHVPFSEKDDAKSLGAKWDGVLKTWYAPDNLDASLFALWFPKPVIAPKSAKHTLRLDLVPSTEFYKNARLELTKKEWESISNDIRQKNGDCCEECGGQGGVPGKTQNTEAHEKWDYQETPEGSFQVLTGIACLCTACHESTHLGLARVKGREAPAIANLMEVNNWTREEANEHICEAFKVWDVRSKKPWILDCTWILENYGDKMSATTTQNILDYKSKSAERKSPRARVSV